MLKLFLGGATLLFSRYKHKIPNYTALINIVFYLPSNIQCKKVFRQSRKMVSKHVLSIKAKRERASEVVGVYVFIQQPGYSSIPGAGQTEPDRTRAPTSV